MKIFRDTMRPAISVGLSVSRVGGRGQTKRQQAQAGATFKALTAYAQALEFARFGSELALGAQSDLAKGELLYQILNQIPGETYNFGAQTLMLDICLNLQVGEQINVEVMKKTVLELAKQLKEDDSNFDALRDELKLKSMVEIKKPQPAKPQPDAAQKEGESDDKDKKTEEKDDKKAEAKT